MSYHKIDTLPCFKEDKFKINCYSRNGRIVKIVYCNKEDLTCTMNNLRRKLK